MKTTISIPLKPYLALYVIEQMQLNDQIENHRVDIDHKSQIGDYILRMVKVSNRKVKQPFKNCLTISIPKYGPYYDARKGFVYIEERDIQKLNAFFEFLMFKEFNAQLNEVRRQGKDKRKSGERKKAIYDFIQKYDDGSGELNYERIKKRYYRYLKSQENRTSSEI